MRAHVAERALSPIDPAAPVERVIERVILDERRDAEKQIPRQLVGNRIGPARAGHRRAEPLHHAAVVPAQLRRIGRQPRRPRDALRPEAERPIRPDMHLADLAEGAALDVLDAAARVVGRVTLVAHLRHDLRIVERLLREVPRLVHRPAQRLLHVHVLAEAHRGRGDRGVHVIGRRHDHRVDVLLLLEHLAIVAILLQPRDLLVDEAAQGRVGVRRGPARIGRDLRLRRPEVLPRRRRRRRSRRAGPAPAAAAGSTPRAWRRAGRSRRRRARRCSGSSRRGC